MTTTDEIMALADEYAETREHRGEDRSEHERRRLRAAVERVIAERDDNETECNIHAACTRLQRERAEYAEKQLKVWEGAANDHYQRAERAEAERDALRALLVEAAATINRKCEAYDFMSDDDGELLARIDAALKEKT